MRIINKEMNLHLNWDLLDFVKLSGKIFSVYFGLEVSWEDRHKKNTDGRENPERVWSHVIQ